MTIVETKGNNAAAQDVVLLSVAGYGTVAFQLTGTFTATQTFEGSVDGVNFVAMSVVPIGSTTAVTTATAVGIWVGNASGLHAVRVRCSAWTSGTATVKIVAVPMGGSAVATQGASGGGAVTIADGADVALGVTTDAAVGDSNGTVNAHVRMAAKQLAALTFDPDDASIAGAQTNLNVNSLGMVWDGSVWRRTLGGNVSAGPVSANVVPYNASTLQLYDGVTGSNSAAVNNGVVGSTVLRVTIASDSSGQVKLATQTDTTMVGGVNVKEINAVAPLMGAGNTGTGSLRVTIASDQVSIPTAATLQTQTDTVMVGGVNIKEINAVAPLMGSGNTGTGSLRVTPAADVNAPTNLAQVGGTTTVTGGVNGSLAVGGPTASGGSLTANPQTIGGLAKTAPPTAVSTGQVVNLQTSIYGEPIVRHCLRETKGNQQTTITSSTAETTIVTADATYKLDLYGLVLANSSATGTKATLKDSTGGTTRIVFWVPANDTRGFMLPASDGHKQNAANNNWTLTCGTSIASLDISALFVQNL